MLMVQWQLVVVQRWRELRMVGQGHCNMEVAVMGALAGVTMVCSRLMRPRIGTGGRKQEGVPPSGGDNNLLTPMTMTMMKEGGHPGGPRYTLRKNVTIGGRGGKPLTKFL